MGSRRCLRPSRPRNHPQYNPRHLENLQFWLQARDVKSCSLPILKYLRFCGVSKLSSRSSPVSSSSSSGSSCSGSTGHSHPEPFAPILLGSRDETSSSSLSSSAGRSLDTRLNAGSVTFGPSVTPSPIKQPRSTCVPSSSVTPSARIDDSTEHPAPMDAPSQRKLFDTTVDLPMVESEPTTEPTTDALSSMRVPPPIKLLLPTRQDLCGGPTVSLSPHQIGHGTYRDSVTCFSLDT